jgi:DNA-binding PadR family transcriptional regulator
MSEPISRLASPDLETLTRQFLREIDALTAASRRQADGAEPATGEGAEPWLYKAYAQEFLRVAWSEVAKGDLQAPARLARHLIEVENRTRGLLPPPVSPLAEAARDVDQLMRALLLADACLEPARLEGRLADRQRSRTQRAVLQCLETHLGEYLRRGEIRDAMVETGTAAVKPSRVGQILADLHRQGLVLRVNAAAQGNPDTAYYTLSAAGRSLCQRLALAPPQAAVRQLGAAAPEIPAGAAAQETAELPSIEADGHRENPRPSASIHPLEGERKPARAAIGRPTPAGRRRLPNLRFTPQLPSADVAGWMASIAALEGVTMVQRQP